MTEAKPMIMIMFKKNTDIMPPMGCGCVAVNRHFMIQRLPSENRGRGGCEDGSVKARLDDLQDNKFLKPMHNGFTRFSNEKKTIIIKG